MRARAAEQRQGPAAEDTGVPSVSAPEGEEDEDDEALMDGAPGGPSLDAWRAARLAKLKADAARAVAEKAKGHGDYREIAEDQFLPEVTGSEWVICHFYHRDFERCKIMDKHLRILAPAHPECKFVSLDAEKAPFFVKKLGIKVLPTLVFFHNGVTDPERRLTGFDGLGKDDFRTSLLECTLHEAGVLANDPVLPSASARGDSEDEDEKAARYERDGRGRGEGQRDSSLYGFGRLEDDD